MKAGETKRFDCEPCSVEFEICLEPKEKTIAKIDTPGTDVIYCPFCGEELTFEE